MTDIRTNVKNLDEVRRALQQVQDGAIAASHPKLHSITSVTDHSSTATSGQMLKANANGLPVNATNTDIQVAAAVAHVGSSSNPHVTTASQVGAADLVSPSVIDNFVAFSDFVGHHKDSGKKATDFASSTHAINHKSGGGDEIKLDELAAPTDVTTLNASATAHGLLPKLSGSAQQYLGGDGAFHDIPHNYDLFLNDAGSDLGGGYRVLTTTNPSGAKANVSASIAGNATEIGVFAATAAMTPRSLGEQVLHMHLHAAQTAGTKTCKIFARLYHRTAAGTETLLVTSDESGTVPGSEGDIDLSIPLSTTYPFASDERLVVKLYGNPYGAGTDPTAAVYYDSTTASRFEASVAGTPPAPHASTHNAGGSDALAIDAAAATGSLRTLGTTATSACAGNDSRLSDSRTPTSHAINGAAHSGAGDCVTKNVGTAAGTVAAGDHTHARSTLGLEYASQADQETGTATDKVVAPGTQKYNPCAAKGWVYFTQSGTTVTVRASYNAGVTRTGVGTYSIAWTTEFSSAYYAVVAMSDQASTAVGTPAADSCTIYTFNVAGASAEAARVSVIAFGDQ